MNSLSINNVTIGYGSRPVIRALSAEFKPGEFCAFIGANGCGKSTLIKAIAGQLAPLSGDIVMQQKALHKWSKNQLAKSLAYLPQHPSAPAGITVRQLVEYGRFAHLGLLSVATVEDTSAVDWAIDVTDLNGLAEKSLDSLSGGERQRAWLAMVLAQKTPVILLDEPTSFLDIGHQYELLYLLKDIATQQQICLITVLHDVNQASQFANRIIALKDGEIYADGTPFEVISEQLLSDVFQFNGQLTEISIDKQRYVQVLPSGRR